MARVLLIEDDYFLRALLKSNLEEWGHFVVDAPNAKYASQLHFEHHFDMIVTDLIMPEKDGFELLLDFRRLDPRVRIIAMSAGGQISAPNYLEMARQLGAVGTLTKPITEFALETVVNQALAYPN
jgi:DNA-binding NtrC family response regulator